MRKASLNAHHPTEPAQVEFADAKPPRAHLEACANVADLLRDDRVKSALSWFERDADSITAEQIRITEIPAPPFLEAKRGAYVRKLLSTFGLRMHSDEQGNVVGERGGTIANECVLVVAHLDTIFPANTDVKVRRDGGLLHAPGISDNGAGLAALVAVARALSDAKIRTERTILFAADVGEEGEGNLRGIRRLVEDNGSKLAAVIALDGAAADYIVTQALASRRVEIVVRGPGGHSWTDFGTPNPIAALSRGIAKALAGIALSDSPRTTFNIGHIEGGGSVNSIPERAAIKVDIRSERETEIGRVDAALRDAIRAGVREEMAEASRNGGDAREFGVLEMHAHVLGSRPGGDLPANSPLLQAVLQADQFLGNRSRIERSSTDANMPLSVGIPAIAIGGGGRTGGAHTLNEWYDPAGRELGLRRVLLTVLGVTGLSR
jgi:tripeptide aminopeptidase